MRSKLSHERLRQNSLSDDEQVRLEIQGFLQALQSYPAHAAKEPDLTFEQHLSALVPYGSALPRRRN
jgi:hypothetical protein